MNGMAILEDSTLVSNWKACFSDGKKDHYYRSLPSHRAEFETLRSFGHSPSNKIPFTASLWFGRKCHCFSDDDHHCGLGYTSCLHSMHLPFSYGASLVGYLGERSGVLL